MRNHIAENPLGAMFYQLGTSVAIQTNNRYQSLSGVRVKRKLLDMEDQHALTINRACQLFVDGRLSELTPTSLIVQAKLTLDAYLIGVVGGTFALKSLKWMQQQAREQVERGLIDEVLSRVKYHSSRKLKRYKASRRAMGAHL